MLYPLDSLDHLKEMGLQWLPPGLNGYLGNLGVEGRRPPLPIYVKGFFLLSPLNSLSKCRCSPLPAFLQCVSAWTWAEGAVAPAQEDAAYRELAAVDAALEALRARTLNSSLSNPSDLSERNDRSRSTHPSPYASRYISPRRPLPLRCPCHLHDPSHPFWLCKKHFHRHQTKTEINGKPVSTCVMSICDR